MFQNAKPIWLNAPVQVNTYALFKGEFAYKGGDIRLLIAADSHYAIYVNGEYVYSAQFADDEGRRVYDIVDLSEYVQNGNNDLVIGGYCTLTDSSVYKAGKPYVIFEIFENGKSVYSSSERVLSSVNSVYKMGDAPLITGQMGYTFHMDLTKKEASFAPSKETGDEYSFIPRPIKNCVMKERKFSRLISQGVFMDAYKAGEPIGQRIQKAFLSYREIAEITDEAGAFRKGENDGVYLIYDLGEEETGLMDIEIEVSEDCEILVGWGEHLDDMRVRAYVGTRNFISVMKAKKGKNHFFHPYRRLGLRYLQLHIYAKKAFVSYAGVRPVHYPVPEKADLQLKDALHQMIYDTCKRTLLLCMHEHYEDCPWREQALYAMDSRNQMLAGYYVFGEYDFAKASLETLARTLRSDNLLELCAPARVAVNIPTFSMMYVVALWEYMLYSGDREFVKRMLPTAETIVESAIARIRENGLAPRYGGEDKWNFYEWSDNLDGHDSFFKTTDENRFDAPMNAFLALSVSRLSMIYRALSKDAEAGRMEKIADQLRRAIHKNFFSEKKGCFYSFMDLKGRLSCLDELTQAICIYAGACPEKNMKKALSRLTNGTMVPVTLAYSIFKYESLLKYSKKYGSWVRNDIEMQWGSMLTRGGTTFFETIKAGDDFDRAGSLCHGWSAVPAYLYFAYGAGIQPKAIGFEDVNIQKASGRPGIKKAQILKRDGSVVSFR
ncbi:MAG: hypothetical protein IKJ65_07185 [Clostridia bacterium]|nr:hypothetical protein [Clostridia bacterium]